MSEKSFSTGARTNPLYGGGSGAGAGSRTPSWTNKGPAARSSAFSEAASSPPDSPGRGGGQYYEPQYEENVQSYTVQTPGPGYGPSHGAESPYRQPSYYVQTPAQSELHRQGDHSPFSSAPPSPPHSIANTTPFDARSTRSGRSRSGTRALAMAGGGLDEEEEEFFPDVERDAFRRRRALKVFCTLFGIGLIFVLFVGTIVAYFMLQPKPPTFQYEGATVNQFYATNGYDASGLPTTQLYANLSFALSTYNPNRYFRTALEGGTLSVGFSNIPNFATTKLPNFTTQIKKYTNFSASVATMAFPLYGAGPLLSRAVADRYVTLNVNINMTSSVPIIWKLIQPKFSKVLLCTLNIDPYSYQFINETCSVPIKVMSLI